MKAAVGDSRRFYGWPLVGIGFVVYGLGIGPGYYSWGFFAPEVMADIGLTRQQVGQIFGAFTLTFAVAGPLAAWSIRRWGLRGTVAVGALVAALAECDRVICKGIDVYPGTIVDHIIDNTDHTDPIDVEHQEGKPRELCNLIKTIVGTPPKKR